VDHADHVDLLRSGVPASGGVWADLGAGNGAFTLALAQLISPGSVIYAIDQKQRPLHQLKQAASARFPTVTLHTRLADFSQPLDLPLLDGLVMANSLHFVPHKLPLLTRLRQYLRPGGRFLLVEYNTDRGNPWVPHPLSYRTWTALAAEAGFQSTQQLMAKPSRFLREIYSAISV
jgi:ubiquinone/menaquinone biosynthesis C-methylase UbiE